MLLHLLLAWGLPCSAQFTANNVSVAFPLDQLEPGTVVGALAFRSDTLYIVNTNWHSVLSFTQAGGVTRIAGKFLGGSGGRGSDDGQGTAASFWSPQSISLDAAGTTAYVSDERRIRVLAPSTATVSTLAGGGAGFFADGVGTDAAFSGITALAFDPSGRIYVTDVGEAPVQCVIRTISTASRVVSTLAGGQGCSLAAANGVGTAATLSLGGYRGLAIGASSNVFLAEPNSRLIRMITPAGVVSTFSGSGATALTDGPAQSASFKAPSELAYYASTDTLFVIDDDHVRAVAADGSVTTIAGGGAFDSGVSTRFSRLAGIAVDALTGAVYLGDNPSSVSTVFRIDLAQPCPPGFFCANNRTGTPCPPGTFNPSAGQGSLSAPCAPGTASPSGQATCSPCAADTYALAQGSGACASCSGGNVSTPAAAVCCALGAWAAPGSATCTACAAGRYRGTAGSSSADCAACPAGLSSYAGAGACCAPGQYLRPGAATCSACRAGRYSAAPGLSSDDGCTPCPSNTYSVTPGAVSDAVCLPCQPGTFASPGATACTACRSGYFLEDAALGRCAECSPGTFSSAGATVCQGCPAGAFTPTGASPFCLPCPAGSFCPAGSAQPSACPANSHVSTLGSANASACEPCPPATLAARGAAECIPDPTAALSCPAGSQPDLQGSSCAALASCPQPLAAYLSAEGRLQFCQACPPGTAGSAPGACAACQQQPGQGLCPGATLRPLWNFSAPESAEAQGPWGGGCRRLAAPAAAAAAAGGGGWGGAGGAAPGGAPEALALQPPSTATLAIGGTLFALLLLCAAALRLDKLNHATLQAALRKADVRVGAARPCAGSQPPCARARCSRQRK